MNMVVTKRRVCLHWINTIGFNIGCKVVTHAERHWGFHFIIPRRIITEKMLLRHINMSTKLLRGFALYLMVLGG